MALPMSVQSLTEAARCDRMQQQCSAVQEHMLHSLAHGTLRRSLVPAEADSLAMGCRCDGSRLPQALLDWKVRLKQLGVKVQMPGKTGQRCC